MTIEDVIREAQEAASEWLEMSDNPAALMVGMLAHRIVELSSYIEYLEKRVNHDSRKKIRVN